VDGWWNKSLPLKEVIFEFDSWIHVAITESATFTNKDYVFKIFTNNAKVSQDSTNLKKLSATFDGKKIPSEDIKIIGSRSVIVPTSKILT
jgi:hypothetical protein